MPKSTRRPGSQKLLTNHSHGIGEAWTLAVLSVRGIDMFLLWMR